MRVVNRYPLRREPRNSRRFVCALGALLVAAVALLGLSANQASAADEDPFAAGADALAVKGADASSSLRAKMKLKKVGPEMIIVSVQTVDDSAFPRCVMTARVVKAAAKADKALKLIARGNTYRFEPVLKRKGATIDLADPITQNNLGACYYPKGTTLVLKIADVDFKAKTFQAGEIYPK